MKTIITTDKAPAPLGPYNQAVLVGNMLYTSGQIAINPESGDSFWTPSNWKQHKSWKT